LLKQHYFHRSAYCRCWRTKRNCRSGLYKI